MCLEVGKLTETSLVEKMNWNSGSMAQSQHYIKHCADMSGRNALRGQPPKTHWSGRCVDSVQDVRSNHRALRRLQAECDAVTGASERKK